AGRALHGLASALREPALPDWQGMASALQEPTIPEWSPLTLAEQRVGGRGGGATGGSSSSSQASARARRYAPVPEAGGVRQVPLTHGLTPSTHRPTSAPEPPVGRIRAALNWLDPG
ncbi:unnamed protein product, partial [Polarella glacialis]